MAISNEEAAACDPFAYLILFLIVGFLLINFLGGIGVIDTPGRKNKGPTTVPRPLTEEEAKAYQKAYNQSMGWE